MHHSIQSVLLVASSVSTGRSRALFRAVSNDWSILISPDPNAASQKLPVHGAQQDPEAIDKARCECAFTCQATLPARWNPSRQPHLRVFTPE
jgi:hypothetical protein